MANAISSDRADKFGSSDEDDEDDDAGWLGGTQFDPGDVDFALTESSAAPTKFGFDDRFESTGKQVFRSTSPDSDDVSKLFPSKLFSYLWFHMIIGCRLGTLFYRFTS